MSPREAAECPEKPASRMTDSSPASGHESLASRPPARPRCWSCAAEGEPGLTDEAHNPPHSKEEERHVNPANHLRTAHRSRPGVTHGPGSTAGPHIVGHQGRNGF